MFIFLCWIQFMWHPPRRNLMELQLPVNCIACWTNWNIHSCSNITNLYASVLTNKLFCTFNIVSCSHCHWSSNPFIIKDRCLTYIEHWYPSAHIFGICCVWTACSHNFLMNLHCTFMFWELIPNYHTNFFMGTQFQSSTHCELITWDKEDSQGDMILGNVVGRFTISAPRNASGFTE